MLDISDSWVVVANGAAISAVVHLIGQALVLVPAAAVVVTLEADEAVASKGADVVDADAVRAAAFLEALVDVDASLAVESVQNGRF